MKISHPALTFEKAKLRTVRVGRDNFQVWMAPDIDSLLTHFIEVGEQNDEWNQQRCPFGAVLWPSARALWQWLNEDKSRFEIVAKSPSDNSVRVLELGSGVGFLAALLSAKTKWSVTASDYEPAYATYLAANCELQGAEKIPFETLDWCEAAPVHLRNSFDIVVACDVLYDDSHLDSLPRIATELLKPNGALLLADPERFRFQTAVSKIAQRFAQIQTYQTIVENSEEDATQSGVVNPNNRQSKVQILHCQNPLTP
jgi:2-polyprenyl-3-methyl-5-hydroxy-6-metoxy-1,4-benzoquinol methylase